MRTVTRSSRLIVLTSLLVLVACSGSEQGTRYGDEIDQSVIDDVPTQEAADADAAAEITDENAEAELELLRRELEEEAAVGE